MKCAFEAANIVEAHMIANLLEQNAIEARIDGEYLAGAVGELPASGLIRVMVQDHHFDKARQIIREWEAKSPPVDNQADAKATRRIPGLFWFIAGALASVSVMSWFTQTRSATSTVDLNGDGRIDQTLTFENGHISKVEGDANMDGTIDYLYRYDDEGHASSSESDLNFDSRFETKAWYERELVKRVDMDFDLDGHVDRREDYINGVLREVTYFARNGFQIVKREHYVSGQLVDAEYDADGDGDIDTYYKYDRFGEITEATRR